MFISGVLLFVLFWSFRGDRGISTKMVAIDAGTPSDCPTMPAIWMKSQKTFHTKKMYLAFSK